jgi:hypothetical protein
MARSIETIKNEIQTAIRTYPSLNDYKFPEEGGSSVGIMNIIVYVMATAIYSFEVLMDIGNTDLQKIADAIPAGNAKWVQTKIKAFQYGDLLVFTDSVPTYPTDNPSARIVTQCSVKQQVSGIVQIKVAKGTAPALTPLSATELTALKNYYYGTSTQEGIGFAGVRTEFVNLSADRIRIQATVYYYGQYVEATVKTEVIDTITSYLETFSEEAFDGTLFIQRLVDAVQALPGVSRFTLTGLKARQDIIPLASAGTIDFQGYYSSVAGYIIPEDTASNTLTDTITMAEETV